jgi:hypothetical protein
MSPPLALSDDQLAVVQRLAEPIVYADRAAYLQRVAQLLRDRELGDGAVHRAAQQAQREFRRAITVADRGPNSGGKYGR